MLASLLDTVLFVATGFAVTVAFLFLYTRVTPYSEFQLINEGNAAAAEALSGALLGFMLPLCTIIAHIRETIEQRQDPCSHPVWRLQPARIRPSRLAGYGRKSGLSIPLRPASGRPTTATRIGSWGLRRGDRRRGRHD